MSNSPLVSYTKLSPNHSGKRTHAIDTITIHCMAGNCSVETCGQIFASSARQASSNYGVGTDGRVALYVDEANRSWCTSSNANDQRAVTIEVANNGGAPDWPVSDKAYAALLDLVTDICKRNGIKKLVWSTSKNDRVNHLNGCNMTVHRDYAAKSCPGDYLYNRHGQIAAEVNRRLGATDTGSSSSSQTSGSTDDSLKVGDVVTFSGSRHYTSSAGSTGSTCKPGKAKITAIAKGKAHPYHLIAVSGGGSTVYGWVDASTVNAELVGQPVHMLARLFPLYEVGAGAADQRGGVFVAASTDERGALLLEVYNVGHQVAGKRTSAAILLRLILQVVAPTAPQLGRAGGLIVGHDLRRLLFLLGRAEAQGAAV